MLPEDRNIHRPPHSGNTLKGVTPGVTPDNNIYFVTARTIDQKPYFDTDAKKKLFCLCLKAGLQKFDIHLYAWVLLNNHFHLLFKIERSEDLFKFINFTNGKSSFELNKSENKQGRKIWYQYFDHCIRDEPDFWKHFNYIHQNPIKHGLRANLAGIFDYPFSSAKSWSKIKGEEWFDSCFELYPIVDFIAGE